jgi:predicted dehydrogenase
MEARPVLRIGVVGAGFMGRLHAATVHQLDAARLVAVVDLDEQVGRSVAAEFGATYRRTAEDAMAEDGIDAYVVALPDRLHVDATSALLSAGRPVLLEKPMAHDLSAATAIAAAAERGGARLMVGHILRFDPRYVAAAQAVAAGEIGDLLHARAGRIASRLVGTRMNGRSSVLFYLGVHDADAIQWVTGRRISRVYARAVSKLMPSLGVPGEDAILSTVDFADGAVGQLFNGWTRADSDPVDIDGRLEVFGTEGSLEIDVRDHGLRVFGRAGLAVPDALHWPRVNGLVRGDLAAEVRHFVAAVERDEPFVVSVADAMRAVAVNDAILRSVESGRPETVEQVA